VNNGDFAMGFVPDWTADGPAGKVIQAVAGVKG